MPRWTTPGSTGKLLSSPSISTPVGTATATGPAPCGHLRASVHPLILRWARHPLGRPPPPRGRESPGGGGFHLFTDPGRIEPLTELVEEGNHRQFSDPAFVDELITWIRFNPGEVRKRQDGLTHAAMGLPSIPRWLGRFVMGKLVTPGSQARSAARAIRSSAALMLLTTDHADPRG
jgi:hypothetical protein